MKYLAIVACALVCSACTPGSFAAPSAGSVTAARLTTIDVNLTKDAGGTTPGGHAAGYDPLLVQIAARDNVRFTNSDGFAHTASSIAGSTFPSAYPFSGAALSQRGAKLSQGFSSGSLAAGATSQVLIADESGRFLFGCFYHYGSPMRAEIDVR